MRTRLDAIELRDAECGCVEYFRVMQYRGFDNPDAGEDPELAQARIFLDELERHVVKLTRRLQTAPTPEARQSINAELSAVRRYVERIHRRFPGIAVAHPFRGTPPGAPAL
ncbi:hypothetical protein NS506_01551 [Nocardia seriolae]|uniref:Uncharacterized protein n=1 Tax=Nocardia seriolae TaxID=37332 RepID=A0ABC8ANP1_9NOCA|nr:hypothetical protein [Nocardia seriolae]APA95622.1 hypothetical protein NS506_01551 [Nocardia seriolae]OJF82891.1 hypothetical protein NS14008_31875 [Nocardia seriolae]PSK28477.1 hypothetical protein C6575_26375 [Nocardia seriolae]QOW32975.1 hypothetical protein IMZ23_34700 [Nocardia seriolae]QUN22030.1 hypothetical protein KEC46_15765 [Nocardia seriolae]